MQLIAHLLKFSIGIDDLFSEVFKYYE